MKRTFIHFIILCGISSTATCLRASQFPAALIERERSSSESSEGSSPRGSASDHEEISSSSSSGSSSGSSPVSKLFMAIYASVFGDQDLQDACRGIVDDLPLDNPLSLSAGIEKARRNEEIRARRSAARKRERERKNNCKKEKEKKD